MKLKHDLYEEGVALAEAFLELNALRFPAWVLNSALEHRGLYEADHERVSVNLSNCLVPVSNPGYSWSFPGYKADNTPIGVVAHETGHHVHHLLGWHGVPAHWYRKPVSGYEPNWAESVAETIRLLITNPNLVRESVPDRFEVVTEKWGLEPVHDLPWRDVLEARGAHPRIVLAADRWVQRKR